MGERGRLPTVLIDTCVLAPMPICDTMLRLAEEPAIYIPKWSAEILRELRSTLVRMGYSTAQAERRIVAMEAAFEDASVTGYERLVKVMANHPKDRHVLAAAVRCRASAIVTHNVKDFPDEAVHPFGIAVMTPDAFLLQQFRVDRELLMEKLIAQAAVRGIGSDALLDRLQLAAPEWVRAVRGSGLSR